MGGAWPSDARRLVAAGIVGQILSSFPAGTSGGGLLILRSALASMAGMEGVSRLSMVAWPPQDVDTIAQAGVALLLVIGAVALLLGFLSTAIAALLAVVHAHALISGVPMAATSAMSHAWQIALAIGVGLTGPGAYSIDARLFGRREIVIPARGRTSRG